MVNARENPERTKQIILKRALGENKENIAEDLNISRTTVTNTLEDARAFKEAFDELEETIDQVLEAME